LTVLALQTAPFCSSLLAHRQTMERHPWLFQWMRLNTSPQLPQTTICEKQCVQLYIRFFPLGLARTFLRRTSSSCTFM